MAESLWNALDDYLAAQLLAGLGNASSYTTLKITQVETAPIYDPQDWLKLYTVPFLIVATYTARSVVAGHDGGAMTKRDTEYGVTVASVTEGTPAQAKQNAAILVHRVEKLLAGLTFAGVTADDGSLLRGRPRGANGRLFESSIEIWQRPSANQPNLRYGVGITAFTVAGFNL